ncbi:MAG: molybdopterin-dependent oxidoreductase, partial [Desulfocapsaceae bacterium]|nr:molybdopterin-dependent oxidoreductase [Desulfocapsaceae bacterium]
LAVARLEQIVKDSGAGSVAVFGSARASLETLTMRHRCCRKLDWREPSCFVDPGLARKISRAIARLDDRLATSLGEIQNADFILVAGADPVREAPMLVLAMRQAVRKGAVVVVIDPRPVSLPFDFTHLPATPGQIEARLASLVSLALDPETIKKLDGSFLAFVDAMSAHLPADPEMTEQIVMLAGKLKESHKPLLICGTGVVKETTPDFAADLAVLLQSVQGECGLFYLFPEANAYGAALLAGADQPSFSDTLQAIEEGTIKAVITVESDPFFQYPDRLRLEKAFAQLELVIALDYLPTATTARAHILLPTATHFETAAHFINQEGRIQFAQPVHSSARPLSQAGDGSHPPRLYDNDVVNNVGEGPQPAWQIISKLMAAMTREVEASTLPEFPRIFAEEADGLAPLRQHAYPVDGVRIVPERRSAPVCLVTAGPGPEKDDIESMELVLTTWTYGTEELSSFSEPVRQATPSPEITMHAEDAARAGLGEGDTVKLHLDRGVLELPLRLSTTMARGIVVLPRHRQLDWQQLQACQEGRLTCRIEKA